MKKLIVLFLLLANGFLCNAQMVKSYMQIGDVGSSYNGPIYNATYNLATWVEWNEDGSACRMLDGTVWKYQGRDNYGNYGFSYAGTEGATMPGVNYQYAIFSPDLSQMKITYTFGMMGFSTQMASSYGYIGEGKDAAYEHLKGN